MAEPNESANSNIWACAPPGAASSAQAAAAARARLGGGGACAGERSHSGVAGRRTSKQPSRTMVAVAGLSRPLTLTDRPARRSDAWPLSRSGTCPFETALEAIVTLGSPPASMRTFRSRRRTRRRSRAGSSSPRWPVGHEPAGGHEAGGARWSRARRVFSSSSSRRKGRTAARDSTSAVHTAMSSLISSLSSTARLSSTHGLVRPPSARAPSR